MKKILTFLMPAVISFSSAPAIANLMTSNTTVKSEETSLTLNFSAQKSFNYAPQQPQRGLVTKEPVSYDISSILTDWNEFVVKYPKFTFKNTKVKMDAYSEKKEDDLWRPFNTKNLTLSIGYGLSALNFDGYNAKFNLSFSAYVDANNKKLLLAGQYLVENSLNPSAVMSYDIHFGEIVFFS
ncbi:hypothetical protein SSYRP_v1c07880 [Spiroplasma syrphidicola EA-1]|uniref:Uncharacterized protein n=1 Tax=Spiroplasma syrphidicola EA-1 TaxID=1276229 RepID=R4U6W9_9MOLU|nr:hypothetical protein [Spiroplasma syrphidicola]AGM26378.1 hypothetical protein SSYRP_v1c07880 [Spiroplasma syrphidicola EA-1]